MALDRPIRPSKPSIGATASSPQVRVSVQPYGMFGVSPSRGLEPGGLHGIGLGRGAWRADCAELVRRLVDVHRACVGIEFDAIGGADLALAGRRGPLAQLGRELRIATRTSLRLPT
jgi:hypothetical protein